MPLRERDIQKQITDHLSYRHIFWYRQNTGAMTGEYKGKKRFVRFSTPGAPDIVCVRAGLFIGIEVKEPGGVQSKDQVKFENELTMAGGKYILAHSLEDVLKEIG
jgi:hypothetical protein